MTLMVSRLAIMAAPLLLALLGEAAPGAEPPVAGADDPSESAEPRSKATDLPAEAADAPVSTTELPAAADADKAQPVKEITLNPTDKPPVCRRYVPTGSRIAYERCVSAEAADAVREAE